jgi:hypothetical protein
MLSASFASGVGVMLSLSKSQGDTPVKAATQLTWLSADGYLARASMWEPISFRRQSREATPLAQPHAASSRCAVPE